MASNPILRLRVVGLAEGVSYLLLLGVAMPLKYAAGVPEAVRVVGSLHGLLFVLYVIAVIRAALWRRWPLEQTLEALAAAIFPLGTFLLDGKLRREQGEPAPPADAGGDQEPARQKE